MALIYNATFDKNTRKLAFEDRAGNEIYSFTVPERGSVDDLTKPLTFRATQDGSTVKLKRTGLPSGAFQTSRDGGNTWTDYTIDTAIALNTGEEVSFRAKANRTSAQNSSAYFYFEMTGKIEAWHNVMSLYRTNDFATYESVVLHAFLNLFQNCTSLTKAPVLPATTLSEDCYSNMFDGCTSLAEAPALLPATALPRFCYWEMFKGCTSLTKSPELPAATLDASCYKNMFYGCSSLNEVHCKMSSKYSSSDISSYAKDWLSNVSSTGTFYTNVDANWPIGASGIPTGWTRVPVDDITKPLTFRATQDGSTVKLTKNGSPIGDFQTSRDGGKTWTDYTLDTAITLNTGDEVSFRAKADRTSGQEYSVYFQFKMTGKIEAWHNVMSMLRTNDFATYESVMKLAFKSLFKGCTSLTKAPALPATTLASGCYSVMFSGCRSLTKAPALPATTLAVGCYQNMFDGCTSLKEAPVLPATTLADYCYNSMFYGCTSLTKSPELPATTLASNCYNSMFYGCRSLNEVRCKVPSSYSSSQISSYAKDWLYNVSSTGTFYTNADANWPSGASGIPTGWNRVNEGAPTVDDLTKPLTFRATQDSSTVKLSKSGTPDGEFQTSTDGGNTWTDYTLDTAITINTGDEVSFRAKADRSSAQNTSSYFSFEMTGEIEAWHNVMSLYRTNDFATYNTVVEYAFYRLFNGCASLAKAPVLPATTLATSCYSNMFKGCTSLTKAPALPATDFISFDGIIDASNCYESMFWGCTSLTEAPELPATKLNIRCYYNMFYDCTSLTKAPELPATILEESCYESMFSGCASLTKAPELPSTKLAFDCYSGMFNYCTSLTKAPALPATTLKQRCYHWMFARCISLTKAPELTATKLASECYLGMFLGCDSLNEVRCQMPSTISAVDVSKYTGGVGDAWLYGVSSTGTFYTNADANWPSGESGIPTGWTRVNA